MELMSPPSAGSDWGFARLAPELKILILEAAHQTSRE